MRDVFFSAELLASLDWELARSCRWRVGQRPHSSSRSLAWNERSTAEGNATFDTTTVEGERSAGEPTLRDAIGGANRGEPRLADAGEIS